MPYEAIEVMLEMLAPDEPFRRLTTTGVPYSPPVQVWSQSELEKGAKYRGYQPDRAYQTHMSRSRVPWKDASEDAQREHFINWAKATWSREIQLDKTERQFVEWLPFYLNRFSTYTACAQSVFGTGPDFLREKYGLPLRLLRRAVK
jgi:hypothetical protein